MNYEQRVNEMAVKLAVKQFEVTPDHVHILVMRDSMLPLARIAVEAQADAVQEVMQRLGCNITAVQKYLIDNGCMPQT